MAITFSACNLAGETIERSSMTYYTKPGAVDVSLETNPHFKIVNTDSSSKSFTCSVAVRDYFIGTLSGETASRSYSIAANSARVFTYTNITFDVLATWQGYMASIHTLAANLPLHVRIYFRQSGSSTIAWFEEFVINMAGADLKKWCSERELPHFDQNYTRLQRQSSTSQSAEVDTGSHCGIYERHVLPPHFPFKTRVSITAWKKVNSTITEIYSSSWLDYTSTTTDYQTAHNSSGAYIWAVAPTGIVKVSMELQWSSDTSSSPTYETVDTMTLYISFKTPLIEWNATGDGIAIGMFPSGYSKVLEVASDWEVDVKGTLSQGLIAKIQDAVYPVGSYIFNWSQSGLNSVISNFPSTWYWSYGSVTISSNTLYYAQRLS